METCRCIFLYGSTSKLNLTTIFHVATKSATGLMEWPDVSTALGSLMLMNNAVVQNEGMYSMSDRTIKLHASGKV